MSAHDNHAHGAGGESHGSVKSYLIGFVLAAILTIIPFWVVMSGGLSSTFATAMVILVSGLLQLLGQCIARRPQLLVAQAVLGILHGQMAGLTLHPGGNRLMDAARR